jgi:hypothetical protein
MEWGSRTGDEGAREQRVPLCRVPGRRPCGRLERLSGRELAVAAQPAQSGRGKHQGCEGPGKQHTHQHGEQRHPPPPHCRFLGWISILAESPTRAGVSSSSNCRT